MEKGADSIQKYKEGFAHLSVFRAVSPPVGSVLT